MASRQTRLIQLRLLPFLLAGIFSILPAEAKRPRKVEVDTTIFTRKATELQEVVVKPKKQKYSKKNNPAVDLMESVRRNAEKGDPTKERYFSYDKYEKMVFSLNNYKGFDPEADSLKRQNEKGKELKKGRTDKKDSQKVKKKKGRTDFLKESIDTVATTGRRVLNLSLKEKGSTVLHRAEPKSRKEIVTGYSSSGLDESLNQKNIRLIMEDIFREIDIYGNDINILQNRFVSPLSRIGADFYKYWITDSMTVDGVPCVELTFAPRNPETFSFNGKLYVEQGDTTGFVKRVKMRVPKAINLNFVDNLFVDQKFEKDSLGNRNKVFDEMEVEMSLVPGTPSLYVKRRNVYNNFSYSPSRRFRDYYDRPGDEHFIVNATGRDETYWASVRDEDLSRSERSVKEMIQKFRSIKIFRWAERIVKLLEEGYIHTGKRSKFDIGPVNTMLSFGDVEGVRMRLGGFTTASLSPHWFFRGYAAYGTKDRKWKYRGEAEYSLNRKENHSREFPIKSFRLSHEYDLDRIGQHYLFTNADNIFLSWKRMKSILVTYRRKTEFTYTLELPDNFSVSASLSHERQEATPWVRFVMGNGVKKSHYDQGRFAVTLRYAPGEKFMQTVSNRFPINMDAPVISLTHEFFPRRWLGSEFTLNRTELCFQKRFWLSAFGYIDGILKAGIVWSQVQYPALPWQNANLSYTIQPESYTLMNPMEFANDKYASVDLTYFANGILFNRIPLLNRLKLREVVTFKALTGGLSSRNDPRKHPELFQFPMDAICQKMTSTPYMELGVGIDNIFRILRVDYVWRLSYRSTPGTDHEGLRVSLHFTF